MQIANQQKFIKPGARLVHAGFLKSLLFGYVRMHVCVRSSGHK